MSNKKVSQLDSALSIALLDLLLLTQVDGNAETGYSSKKITVSDLANKLNSDIQYATDLPDFTDKTITGALQELKDMLISQIPVVTISPSPIANFNTDLALPLKSLKVEIKPKQASGTPTPSSPLPISGTDTVIVTQLGKNLWSGNSTISGTYRTTAATFNLPADTYTFSALVTSSDTDGTKSLILLRDVDNGAEYVRLDRNTRSNVSITFAKPIVSIQFFAGYNDAQSAGDTFTFADIQIEKGSTATTYEPYTATTKTVSLPSTVYGGEVDVIGGSGASNYTLANLSDLTWENAEQSGKTIFYARVDDKINNVDNIAYCEIFASATSSGTSLATAAALLTSDFMICTSKNTTNPRIYVRADGYTGAQFANAIAGYKVAYQLATPTPITLANPIDLTAKAGVNNVFGDTDGNTSVEFRESIQKYIDEQIAATQALIL